MTDTPTQQFNQHAQRPAQKSTTPKPFCIRLTQDERAMLERKAGRMPLGRYIRTCLLGDSATKRRTKRKARSDAQKVLAQLLAALGQSGIRQNLAHLSTATQHHPALFTAELRAVVIAAREDLTQLRMVLIDANRAYKSVQETDVKSLKVALKRLKHRKRNTQLDDMVNMILDGAYIPSLENQQLIMELCVDLHAITHQIQNAIRFKV